jgi:predicted MFS family arabinose efflux permease
MLIGLTGAARGLSTNFAILLITVFLSGLFGPLITLSNFKNAVLWFPPEKRGSANGLATLGMAFGFFVGSLVSAAYLSPALNGWRNVFFLYGGMAMLLAIPWAQSRSAPKTISLDEHVEGAVSIRQSISYLARIRELWLLGMAVLGVSGAIQGLLGFIPLYLQGLGWEVASTGGVMAVFNVASMICVLPLTIWSDRSGKRSRILLGAALMIAFGIGALSLASGAAIWVLMAMIGSVRDGFMGIYFTRVTESRGVGSTYSGMAIGFSMVFIGIGNLIAPPLGNSLASQTLPGAPLIFWAAMALFGGACILLVSRGEKVVVVPQRGSLEDA